jgi:hypothetical protein
MSDTNPQSTLDEQAAREYAIDNGWTLENFGDYQHEACIEGFLAGAKFARQAAERDVAELVAALESLASNICSPISMTDARSQLSELENRVESANSRAHWHGVESESHRRTETRIHRRYRYYSA